MFSYRHAFHAGNHADVLKHIILIHTLNYLGLKEAPYWYLDTHAGAGLYELDGDWANKTAEYERGVARLWNDAQAPDAVQAYLTQIRAWNPGGDLRYYPGSPFIAAHMIRERDRLRLFELHPTEIKVLQDNFENFDRQLLRRTMFYDQDGFAGVKTLLPPTAPTRRAVTLIDPSYEDKKDYGRVLLCVQEGLQRFSTGTFIIWYPEVQRADMDAMVNKLWRLPVKHILHARLTVSRPPAQGVGLYGSGVIVINPPWTLHGELEVALPYMTQILGEDDFASYMLDQEERQV